MAGHSKWANIKHRKAAQDAKRGKIFTKLIRELVVAAKEGGPAPEDNPRLRAAVDKALGSNMKRDTIDKAIARGAGAGEGDNYEEITYEGYGAGGIAVLVECLSDNRNRTVSDVRHAFTKRGGNLGTDGSVAYLFTRTGQISYAPGADEDQIMEIALEAGAIIDGKLTPLSAVPAAAKKPSATPKVAKPAAPKVEKIERQPEPANNDEGLFSKAAAAAE